MFCSVKKRKDKYDGEIYRFYLCKRYRDKETGKVKSSDKYIMTLQDIDFTDLRVSFMAKYIKKVLAEKEIVSELEQDLIYDKYLDIREEILERERAKQEEERKRQQEEYNQYREYYKSYSSGFSSGTSSINFDDTTKELAKEFIKLGYRAMAKKYHPDITKDNGEKMKAINEIKDKLENIF
ncbi:MAG: molecular chaperone DnaJ [Clostridium perfringens]|nr:molecular chaperone DnaJ [Clostridium perfringens]